MSEQGRQTELNMGQPAAADAPAATEQPAAQPAPDSAPLSFRERTLQRLSEESSPPPHQEEERIDTNVQQDDLVEQEAPQDAHQPDDGYPTESLDLGPTGDLPEPGVDNSNVEGVLGDEDVTELRQRAEKAESLTQSMQTDYTQKTQKLGESRRELETSLEQSTRISQVYAQRANANLARYKDVNWQQLQSTLDPQVYNQRVAEYRQSVSVRDNAIAEHESIAKFATEQVDKQRRNQAEDSRNILRNTIPGWGDELYRDLRDFAVSNLAFTESEFSDLTDHRFIRMFHDLWKISNTGKTVQGIQQHHTQQRPPGQNKARSRGADGRFQKAQEEHVRNPGDRNATRDFFRARLEKERLGSERR